MRHAPTGADLLDVARRQMLDVLVPALPAEHRYAALMVANAMAIAGREMRNGAAGQEEELWALSALYGEVPEAEPGDPQAMAQALEAIHRQVCADIRAGRMDPHRPEHDALRATLEELAQDRVAETNPRYLSGT
ncbi:MAG: hypothetical protein KDE22_06730 [Rhodobacterales bacterium]|nr:hypothetical protein [Rhodobacterales bacterium]